MLVRCENILISCKRCELVWAPVWAGPHSQPLPYLLCISTVKVLAPREQAILFSHRWASHHLHPLSPPPTTISDLQSLLYSNKYYLIIPPNTQTLSSLLTSHRTCRGTIIKYFGGWLVSFTMDHGHPFKLHLTAICGKQVDFTTLSSQWLRSEEKW